MMRKRRLAAGIGAVAMVGMALWLRELASWRPATLTRLNVGENRLYLSHDGKWLWREPEDFTFGQGLVLRTSDGKPGSQMHTRQECMRLLGQEFSPRIWRRARSNDLFFAPDSDSTVYLGANGGRFPAHLSAREGTIAWSKSRNEVYAGIDGKISVWNATTGKLKKRVSYGIFPIYGIPVRFSMNGKWLLAVEGLPRAKFSLFRCDVQTGKRAALVSGGFLFRSFGFSRDERFIWSVEERSGALPDIFTARKAADGQLLWSAEAYGPVKWLSGNRIGIPRKDCFEVREATGRLIRRLPGPFERSQQLGSDISDWVISADEKWIYSLEQDGTIRRWRAK